MLFVLCATLALPSATSAFGSTTRGGRRSPPSFSHRLQSTTTSFAQHDQVVMLLQQQQEQVLNFDGDMDEVFMDDLLFDFPDHDIPAATSNNIGAKTLKSASTVQTEAVQSVMNAALLMSEPDLAYPPTETMEDDLVDASMNERRPVNFARNHHDQQAALVLLHATTNREEELHRRKQEMTGASVASFGNVLDKANELESEVNKKQLQTRKQLINVKDTGMDSVRNYMKTMCNHELLNKNEEIILAREIQILVQWEKIRDELEAELLR
jgi:hypothetical protein